MVVRENLVTAAMFEAFIERPEHADRRFELIDGEIVEKVPTQKHGVIAARLIGEIYIYLKTHPGQVASEVRHCIPGDEHNNRLPDVSFYSDTSEPLVERGAVPRMPDLAVEIQSPDDSPKVMADKAAYYLANGARMVWLVYPSKKLIEVLTLDDRQLLTEEDTLDGGDVLPGFTLSVKDILKA